MANISVTPQVFNVTIDDSSYLVTVGGDLVVNVTVGAAIGVGGSEFLDSVFRVNNVSDPTKQIALDASGITTSNMRTLTVPDSDGTLTLAAFAQDLTNKTIDPSLNTIDGDVLDITFAPSLGYIPDATPPEASDIGDLTAHLAGIATALDGRGDLDGPGSAVDNALARFDGVTGKILQGSLASVDDGGNLALPGTVDGRDIAVDGTKLDGIEALADVTDAINVAAAGAVMDGDFSSNGLMVRTGAGTYAVDSRKKSKTITILDPGSGDDISVWFTDRAITITEIRAVRTGGTDIDWVLYHGTTAHATTNTIYSATSTATGSGDNINSGFVDATVPLDSFITFIQGTTDGTPTEISLTIFFTED